MTDATAPALNGDLSETALVARACAKDRTAFQALVRDARKPLRTVVRRLVGHPEDTEDIVQETLLRAWDGIAEFQGKSRFSTWLCAIGTRLAIDHLRRQQRWRPEAQVAYANLCASSEEYGMEAMGAIMAPEFSYEVREHIAYCFVCVGRSLPPDDQAALVLRDVMGMDTREAAKALEVTESVLRHRLSAARREMTQTYEGLCSLVSKQGICYQCKGLREAAPEARRGEPAPSIETMVERLAIARDADIDTGKSQIMHDVFWQRTKEIEDTGAGSVEPESDCGQDDT
ncbi:MAG: RNA polymerase sigma factor [Pseudomonadota bacterium]